MKNKLLILILSVMLIGTASMNGCNHQSENMTEESRAYNNQSQDGEDEAVNTLQIGRAHV